jgi:hypothetical protein
MTPEQRIARAHSAKRAWDEFVAPVVTQMRETYAARIVEIAATELSRDKRTDKITALSNAVRILDQIEGGLSEAIHDGDVANVEKLRAEKIEGMTAPKRRLLGMAPY